MRLPWAVVTVVVLAVQARPRGDGPPEDSQQCLFLLATPGSGSTSLLKLFQEHSQCEMTGENWGAFIGLGAFDAAITKTLEQPRGDEHDEAAWKRVFRPDTVRQKQRALVRSVLNPRERGCFGFKEVRYGRGLENVDSFGRDVAMLSSLCARPVVVLHTRRRVESELGAHIISNGEQALTTHYQWACFDAFAGNLSRARALGPDASARVLAGCARAPRDTASPLLVRRHTLEDYLEQTPNHLELWKLLGLAPPAAYKTIRLRTDVRAHDAELKSAGGGGPGAPPPPGGAVELKARVRVIRGPHEGVVGIVIQKWAAMLKVRPVGKGPLFKGSRRVFQVRSADVIPAPPRPTRRDRDLGAPERALSVARQRRRSLQQPPDSPMWAPVG